MLDSGCTDDLAELKATQASGDNILGRHAGDGAQVHALTGMKLGGYNARADDLNRDAFGCELGVELLRPGDRVGERSGIDGAARHLLRAGWSAERDHSRDVD